MMTRARRWFSPTLKHFVEITADNKAALRYLQACPNGSGSVLGMNFATLVQYGLADRAEPDKIGSRYKINAAGEEFLSLRPVKAKRKPASAEAEV